jgi:recombination protein RecA
MSKALRKLTALCSQSGTTIVFINQTRMKIGIMFGNPTTTPGGMALKFFSSVRISLDRIAKIQKGDKIIGNRIKAKVVKNKVAPPFREAEFDILFNKGINKEGDAIKTAEKLGVLTRTGNTYKYDQKVIGSSFEAARQNLEQNPSLFNEIIEKIKKVALGADNDKEK